MDSNKKEVMEFISANFDISKVTLVDFPILPGGVILTDSKNNKMLFYWDILRQKVIYEFEE